jgi:hypothetical protein
MTLVRFFALCLAIAFSAAVADAKPSFTPPVSATAGAIIDCTVQNVGTKPRTVNVVARGNDGAQIAFGEVEVAPGAVRAVVTAGPGDDTYCEFEGLTRTVRGFIHVIDDVATTVLLPAIR